MLIKDHDGLKNYLNSKISPITCPMCKSNKGFTPYAEEFHDVSYNRTAKVLDPNAIAFISVALCRCNNCGFVAEFDLSFVTGDPHYATK